VGAQQGHDFDGYLTRKDIPYHYALADAFTVCDAYHCSLLGPTDPNRYHMWTGWVGNDGSGEGPVIDNAEAGYGWSTYPERLESAGISWKIYQDIGEGLDAADFWGWTGDRPYIGNYGDNSLLYFHQYQNAPDSSPLAQKARTGTNILKTGTLFDIFRQDVRNNQLPQVSWIVAPEAYTEHGNWPPNYGAWYVSQMLDALTANPEMWSKTVVFYMFDENDGFFDHIVPPTPPPSRAQGISTVGTENELFAGNATYVPGPYGLGVRVPMIVISPWSKGGWVNSEVFGARRSESAKCAVIPGSQIPFVTAKDKDNATIDIIGVTLASAPAKAPPGQSAKQGNNKTPVQLAVGRLRDTVKLAVESTRDVRRKNVQYNTGFVLAPGSYHLKFVVRENQTGRMGSFETDVRIPDLRKSPLKMSSVILSSQRISAAGKKKGANPLVRQQTELVPNITHVFTPGQHLYLQYDVYDPAQEKNPEQTAAAAPQNEPKSHPAAKSAHDAVRVFSSVEFIQNSAKVFESSVTTLKEMNSPERKAVTFQMDLPLQSLKPGLYLCQINVIDDVAGSFSFPRFPILIREAITHPPSSAAAMSEYENCNNPGS